jgi:hypothetical protein
MRTGLQRTIRTSLRMKDNSINAAIIKRRYPVGGLKQLQAVVREKIPSMLALVKTMSESPIISASMYGTFMAMLYSSVYVFGPNGRVGGEIIFVLFTSSLRRVVI